MIPRLKPYFNQEEILALIAHEPDAVRKFEMEFTRTFNTKHAIAFSYGRSALWAFFNAMGIKNSEIIQPAYTCSVVAHATVLSTNIPRFVDITFRDYNMDLDLLVKAITRKTRAVIPTHLFGYPMDIAQVEEVIKDAERRFGHRIYCIQDCAHSFEAEWLGRSVVNAGDGALFGLGISKQITSIFGGMFTTNDDEIEKKLRKLRDAHFSEKSFLEKISRGLYLLAAMVAFSGPIYRLTYWLQDRTSLLKGLTDAYHLDEKIHFPPDYDHKLASIEARVGRKQLEKYPFIKTRRREIADYYFEHLHVPDDWVMPPRIKGATYSHFPIRVPARDAIMTEAARRGVQLGRLIEYSMPHLRAYQNYIDEFQKFPISKVCSQSLINLPMHPSLSITDLETIKKVITSV